MKLGIDASNLRTGGGRTHLIELLGHAEPHLGRFGEVVVWGSAETLDALPARRWLVRRHEPMLDGSLPARVAWQHVRLSRLARDVDLLFAPGGVTSLVARPRVVMSQNLLPFDAAARGRYRPSRLRLRLELLRVSQQRSFATADGVIFLNEYARHEVTAALPRPPRRIAVVPHGVADRFRRAPRPQRPPAALTAAAPLRVLYVSQTAPYKHHLEVIAAVGALGPEVPVELTLVGPPDTTDYTARVAAAVRAGRVCHRGAVEHDEVHHAYHAAEVFVFASSCENLPIILLEAMAAALPIACSRRGPMPTILGDAGVYFDPERPAEIAGALRTLAGDAALRGRLAAAAAERARSYTWDRCARETFAFLADVAGSAATNSARRWTQVSLSKPSA